MKKMTYSLLNEIVLCPTVFLIIVVFFTLFLLDRHALRSINKLFFTDNTWQTFEKLLNKFSNTRISSYITVKYAGRKLYDI